MWEVPAFLKPDETNSLVMVLIGQKGAKIHSTVIKQLIYVFHKKLVEGEVYKMSYFFVVCALLISGRFHCHCIAAPWEFQCTRCHTSLVVGTGMQCTRCHTSLRMWEVPSFLNLEQPNSIEMVLIDEKRRGEVRVLSGRFGTVAFESDPDQLKSAREDIKELLGTKFCHPLMDEIVLY